MEWDQIASFDTKRGVLTMLDSRGGEPAGAPPAAAERGAADLDDDIPF